MDYMNYAKEAGRLIKNGPDEDETSLLRVAVGLLLYWRVWASVLILYTGLYAVTLLTGPQDVLLDGWVVGYITGFIVVVVMADV